MGSHILPMLDCLIILVEIELITCCESCPEDVSDYGAGYTSLIRAS